MSGLAISLTDPFDADALALINASDIEQAELYPPEVQFALSPRELVECDVRFFVARQAGAALGCCGYQLMDGYAEVKRVFVRSEMRGTGVAAALMKHAEASAAREGVVIMRLETGVDSPAALRLYQGLGYDRRGPFGAYADNGASVFMEKALGHG